jgi:hypothetical protein
MRALYCTRSSLAAPNPPSAPLPRSLVVVADALLGMVGIYLLLLVFPLTCLWGHPVSQFCSEMLQLTFGWARYHHGLDILLPIFGSTPQLHHPPVRPSLTSTLSFSACLLISLVWRTRPRVFQWTHRFAVVGMVLRLASLSYNYSDVQL